MTQTWEAFALQAWGPELCPQSPHVKAGQVCHDPSAAHPQPEPCCSLLLLLGHNTPTKRDLGWEGSLSPYSLVFHRQKSVLLLAGSVGFLVPQDQLPIKTQGRGPSISIISQENAPKVLPTAQSDGGNPSSLDSFFPEVCVKLATTNQHQYKTVHIKLASLFHLAGYLLVLFK